MDGVQTLLHLHRVAGVDAMLRGNDVRSQRDLVAASHSLYCGPPVPWSYCFFCELASSVGGAAPMNSSAEVADVGLTIHGSALGWSWEVTYNAATKKEAEAVVHKRGTTYWWLLDGYSRTATALLPTIHKKPRASVQVFQLRHLAFISWNDVRNGGDEALVFVDGMPWMIGCTVRGLIHGGETCRARVVELRRAPWTPSCHLPCACNVARGATPHFSGASCVPTPSAVSFDPALRVGISGAEMISQEYIRNVPVFSDVQYELKNNNSWMNEIEDYKEWKKDEENFSKSCRMHSGAEE